MKDGMLDIETLGRKSGCIVLSVGIVQFDPRGNGYGEKFYRNINLQSSHAAGLVADPETVAWWTVQPAQAKAALETDPRELANVAYEFCQWWHSLNLDRVWCQGASFDAPILTEAFEKVGVKAPWEYWNVRDTRTAYDLCGFDPYTIKRGGNHHYAIDDCVHQILCVQTAISMRKNIIDGAVAVLRS